MELRHVRYFLALAEELNFSRAAQRLHIAQPPLSRQIRELEEHIGVRLFHRTKRQVQLTAAGKVFMTKAYQIMDQVEQAYLRTRLTSTGVEGEIRIGFSGAVHDMMPTLQQFRKRFPKVAIYLKHTNSAEQMESLLEGRLDIGVIAVPVNNSLLEVHPLPRVQFLAALPNNHPLVDRELLYLHDLADETFIMTPKSSGPLYYDMVMGMFQQARIAPNLTIQAHDLQTVLAMVASGMGVTIAPLLLHTYRGVVNRKLEDVNLSLQASLVWRKDNRSQILDNLLAMIAEQPPAPIPGARMS